MATRLLTISFLLTIISVLCYSRPGSSNGMVGYMMSFRCCFSDSVTITYIDDSTHPSKRDYQQTKFIVRNEVDATPQPWHNFQPKTKYAYCTISLKNDTQKLVINLPQVDSLLFIRVYKQNNTLSYEKSNSKER